MKCEHKSIFIILPISVYKICKGGEGNRPAMVTPLSTQHTERRGRRIFIQGQRGLYCKFQVNWGYIVRQYQKEGEEERK